MLEHNDWSQQDSEPEPYADTTRSEIMEISENYRPRKNVTSPKGALEVGTRRW